MSMKTRNQSAQKNGSPLLSSKSPRPVKDSRATKPINGASKPRNGSAERTAPDLVPRPTDQRSTKEPFETPCSGLLDFFNNIVCPLLIVGLLPTFVVSLSYACELYDGSFMKMFGAASEEGPLLFVLKMWKHGRVGDPLVLSLIGSFVLLQLILMVTVPGSTTRGPVTSTGYRPSYTNNGFSIFVIDMVLFGVISYYLKMYTIYSPSYVYDNFTSFTVNLNLIGYLFCLVLYFKGRSSPSKGESGSSSNFLFDYYWGLELYPRIFGIDVKVFTNCRFGCTLWAILPCCFAFKSYELHGFVDSMFVYLFLLLAYLTKFFWWEGGYMNTLDMILDRAGFYICWGCICYVTGMYTISGFYLVSHPIQYGQPYASILLTTGLLALAFNYAADWEKEYVRKWDGKCSLWGKPPVLIRAKYINEEGREKNSLLLASGFWGISRHFHYVPEWVLAFMWSYLAGVTHLLPYTYFIFLVILLIHRAFRDDAKCRKKYGKYWEQYCARVPYKVIPYVF